MGNCFIEMIMTCIDSLRFLQEQTENSLITSFSSVEFYFFRIYNLEKIVLKEQMRYAYLREEIESLNKYKHAYSQMEEKSHNLLYQSKLLKKKHRISLLHEKGVL